MEEKVQINVNNSLVSQTMNDWYLVEVDVVHNEVDHFLVEAVGVHKAAWHTDDHFLHLYVEVQHLSV